MPQRTNLNINPYFDDYNEEDNYYKVLFKPGFPVQARELNFLQSALQNQIEQFGDHLFKDGSVVIPGGVSFDDQYYAVKINQTFLGIDVSVYIDKFIGTSIRGQTSKITAKVINVLPASESETGDLTLYIKYLNSSDTNEFSSFIDGELLLAQDSVEYGNTTITPGASFAQCIPLNSTSIGSAVSIDDGIYFVRGFFARVAKQSLILDQYSNDPSYRVGLQIVESTVNANEDNDLFDNAKGFTNFSAPGADRFKFNLVLAKKLRTDQNDRDFIEILRVNDGQTEIVEQKTQYNLIKDYLAQRTFDESGDYAVTPFSLTLQETLNNEQGNNGLYSTEQLTFDGNEPTDDLVTLTVGPGKAYIKGFDNQVLGFKNIDIPKSRDTKAVKNSRVSIDLGSRLRVDNVFGTPAIGLDKDSTYVIELFDQRTNSNTSGTGEKIGEARVYSFTLTDAPYEDDTSKWDLRLFDIQTYTKFTVSQGFVTLPKGSYIVGRSSGARGFTTEAITGTSNRVVTLHQVSGTFINGEQISINGNIDNPRSITDIISFDIDDVRSVYQDASSLGLQSDFVADVILLPAIATGFNITDNAEITAASGGVSTVTSPGKRFSGISSNTIIQYQNPSFQDVVYNRIISISADGLSADIEAIPNVAGVATGLLPTTSLSVPFRVSVSNYFLGDSEQALITQLTNPNIASIDLQNANIPVISQILGQTSDAFGEIQVSQSSVGLSSAFFEEFDVERYNIAYSDGTIETLTRDQASLNANGNVITFTGARANQTNITVNVTSKKSNIRSKQKTYSRSNKITVNKSLNRSAGVTTNTANGLDYNDFYGLRVEDREVSLNVPDVARVIAIYESVNSEDPTFDKLTFEAGLDLDTASILGEYITGPNNKALAQVVTRLSPTEVEVVFLNEERFSLSEELTFQESGIFGVLQSFSEGLYIDRSPDFELDKGQRSDFYDYSRIVRKATSPAPTRRLTVVYNSYTIPSSDQGDIFTVLSYDPERYKLDIPEIEIQDANAFGSIVRATDTIDFRPRVIPFNLTTASPFDYDSRDFSGPGATTPILPKADESISVNYEYYLPRTDKLVVDTEGKFKIIPGVSAVNPEVPQVSAKNDMALAILQFPPYVYDVDDINIINIDNKRYTMRDIASLEERIESLEETTSLSLLEQRTNGLQIQDADGLNRFKSGFFADDFRATTFVNSLSKISVDSGINQLICTQDRNTISPQPAPFIEDVSPNFDFSENYGLLDANLQKTGNVVTLRYDEQDYVEQPFATRVENVNPFNIIDWIGTIQLNPPSDTWTQNLTNTNNNTIERFRTINTNRIVNNTNVTQGRGFIARSGQPAAQVQNSTTSSTSTTTTRDRALQNISANIDIRERSARFIRSRNVEFKAEGLKPFTRYYPFFDGSNRIDVIPKLLEVENVSGSFRSGETVDGFFRGVRLFSFRICDPNHKEGPFNAPTTFLDANPYDRDIDLGGTFSYNSSSTFLNVDTAALAFAPQGAFFGRIVTGMQFIGRTSNAQATLSDIRLVTDSFGSLYGSFFFRQVRSLQGNNQQISLPGAPSIQDPTLAAPRFRTGTKTFKLTSSPTNEEPVAGDLNISDAEAHYTASGTIRRTTLNITQTALTTIRNDTTTNVTNNVEFRIGVVPAPRIINRNFIERRIRVIQPIVNVDNRTVNNITNVTQNVTRNVTQNVTVRRPVERVTVVRPVVREVRTIQERVREVRVPARRRDPLAQTFLTDSQGGFLTSVDIYLRTKDVRTPLTVELRTVELGTPTTALVADEARVVINPVDIEVSEDASVPLNVKFPVPILLDPRTEYAIVLLSPTSDNYTAWIARLGERAVNTSGLGGSENVLYSRQYGAGSLFKSQNGSIWTASQFEDLKFKVKIAQFQQSSGTLTLYNPDLDSNSDILPTLPANPIKALPRKLDVGITTVESADMQAILTAGRKVGVGNTISGFIENTGGPINGVSVVLAGTGYSAGTYSDVNFFSINGQGSGATGVVTVTGTGVAQISIANSGTGYQIGESLGITTSDVFRGTDSMITVDNIYGFDSLFLTNVNGENFTTSENLTYYEGDVVISLANTTIVSSNTYDQIYSGNIIQVLHPSHGMHSIDNDFELKNIFPNTSPTTLTESITNTSNIISIGDTSTFGSYQGITTSQGYALVGNEIVFYNSIGNGTLGIATRGALNSLAGRHAVGDKIYSYSFAGVGLDKINTTHTMSNNPAIQNRKGIDDYYVEISRADRDSGDDQLNFNNEVVGGGNRVFGSRNIMFDRITTNIDSITPGDTRISGRIRSISATSASGEESSFDDLGFEPTVLNSTVIYPEPRMVASKLNESNKLDVLPRNKSLTVEVDMFGGESGGRLSPVVFTDQLSFGLDRTRINRPITDYAGDPRVNSVDEDPHAALYVSDRISLKNQSTSIKVFASAYVDLTADIRCLYRVFRAASSNVEPQFELFPGYLNLKDTDGDGFGDEIIDVAKNDGRPDKKVPSSLQDEFRDYQWTIDDLEPFDSFQIKIVFSGTNEALAPRLNDVRTIALA